MVPVVAQVVVASKKRKKFFTFKNQQLLEQLRAHLEWEKPMRGAPGAVVVHVSERFQAIVRNYGSIWNTETHYRTILVAVAAAIL